jgi:DNA polymerase-1
VSTDCLFLDFETEPAVTGSRPRPVGAALWEPNAAEPVYLAFAHPAGNNTTQEAVEQRLRRWRDAGIPIVCHSAGFDLAVAEKHLELPWPARFEDTQVAAFLAEPNARFLGLKELGESLLGIAPDEQKTLDDYIRAHVPGPGSTAARYHLAPGHIVGPYAIQDVRLTRLLHEKLAASGRAYARELALVPIIVEMELTGVRLDMERLHRDVPRFRASIAVVERGLYRRLGRQINLDSTAELADALERAGVMESWVETKEGGRSVSHEALARTCRDPEIIGALRYVSTAKHQLSNHLEPWLKTDGRARSRWNATVGEGGGARTGRFSTSPNLQNLVRRPPRVGFDANAELWLPGELRGRVGPLPDERSYLLPEVGHVFVIGDFQGQEMRAVAHFENGPLCRAYRRDPDLDVHERTRILIERDGAIRLSREDAKRVGFAILYGGGINRVSVVLGLPRPRAKAVRDAFFAAHPGLKEVIDACRERFDRGEPITTLGGRAYTVQWGTNRYSGEEGPLSYLACNTLVQGSSADMTKAAMIAVEDARPGALRLSIHDELVETVPQDEAEAVRERQAAEMVEAAETVGPRRLRVPMRVESRIATSFAKPRRN